MTDQHNEAAHGLQAGAAKQRIDEQAKPVPPAVCEYAVQELAALKARPSGANPDHTHLSDLGKARIAAIINGGVDERAAFEAHMRLGGYSNPDKHPDGSYVSSAMEFWWQGWKARAALSAPSHGEQVREGWQLVPVEPTPEMVASMINSAHGYDADIVPSYMHLAYSGALAAAPSAGSQEQGE